MKVLKFGGTSVGSIDNMMRVKELITDNDKKIVQQAISHLKLLKTTSEIESRLLISKHQLGVGINTKRQTRIRPTNFYFINHFTQNNSICL